MEFQDVVQRRRMVRDLSDRPLPADVVQRILANGQRGPSSGFTQGFDFVVFDEPHDVERFWSAVAHADYLRNTQGVNAPFIVVAVADPSAYVEHYRQVPETGRQAADDFPAPYWFADTGCAIMLMLLTAVDAGLGGFWFSIAANSDGVPSFKTTLGIPDHMHPLGAIAFGYPSEIELETSRDTRQRVRARRRDSASRIHRGGW